MSLLAHGGGAPEAAMIGLPLVLFAVFLLLERRARRRELPPAAAGEATESGPKPPDPGQSAA